MRERKTTLHEISDPSGKISHELPPQRGSCSGELPYGISGVFGAVCMGL